MFINRELPGMLVAYTDVDRSAEPADTAAPQPMNRHSSLVVQFEPQQATIELECSRLHVPRDGMSRLIDHHVVSIFRGERNQARTMVLCLTA